MPRTAVITGAGSGVGRAAAVRLSREGWRVALLGRRRATLDATGRLLAAGSYVVVECDVGAPGASAGAADAARAFCGAGGLDALLNVAGVAPRARVGETDEARLRGCFDANAAGPALLVAALWDDLVAARGRVVNVSSFSAVDPFAGFLAYGASKAALESLTRSVNVEGGRAHTLRLGAVETPMLRGLFDEAQLPPADALPPDAVAAEISAILAGDRDDRAVVELVVNPKDGATFDNDAPAAPPPPRPPRWHLPDFFRRS